MAGISRTAPLKLESRYKFNGIEINHKEFSDESGLDLYSAYFRNLDPQIGRWWQIDPRYSHDVSPYASMDLNPVLLSDILGDTTLPEVNGLPTVELPEVTVTAHGDNDFYGGNGPLYTGGFSGPTKFVKDNSNNHIHFNFNNKVGYDPWKSAFTLSGLLLSDDASGIGAIDDIAIPAILAVAATYDATNRIYVTYTLSNPLTNQIYVGRASGFGDPYSIMMRRYAGHHMRAFGFQNPTLDKSAQGFPVGYGAIRGREQQLIDFYGGVGSPRVGNRIRGVSTLNPAGFNFWSLSNIDFGNIAPFTGRILIP